MTNQNINICHLTSVHPSRDTRIFYRECVSLAKAGYNVTLIAPNEKREETVEGVKIIAFPPFKNRFFRILFAPLRMFLKARKQKAAIYHFHDPELIFTGLLLKLTGANVVFDIHENIVKQIKNKKMPFASSLLSWLFKPFNYISARAFHLVLAEHSYESIYKKTTDRYETILNMPDTDFFETYNVENRRDKRDIFYIGGVSKLRGVDVTLEAMFLLNKRGLKPVLHLVGPISNALKEELEALDFFPQIKDRVVFYGRKNLDEGYSISRDCLIGISVLKPIENYLHSYSTKIFEYMSISMPVVTSDFQLYRDVIDRCQCGTCIDPTNPEALANALAFLLENKEEAAQMGQKGREAALKEFNYSHEEKKLYKLYEKILSS